ncbi:putative zinc-binding alcohol dehydrogenase [Microdochium trichocladiopsis]|uniref:alcohol dehydrogenase (NADP(+)) n=1 Tax=Microdochium trichocladiopsis TaxID=1682393 RepID=A0A9P9BRK8_9PEZI|nr:putative zinc-binding alcohol dehydrogenase [Microdochium trichocladiopsis]KAH7033026.1 putative zinc-binding alcohol dehydrogenase [Microdochium trichocladiopsis]
MAQPRFQGWIGHDKESVNGKLVWGDFEPKRWEETDIDIKITHCGMCASDLHTLSSGWYKSPYPIVVGHEIVGRVVRVGSKAVGNHKVGDRVGVGCLTDCCMSVQDKPCDRCAEGQENYCLKSRWTYPGPHHNGDKGWGGYATHHRCPGRFAFKIPDAIGSAQAATLMCAGITMYAPLKHNNIGPGKSVGIVGIGGLGHYGVLLAKAMGADRVVAISRKRSKRDEVLALGADDYIATDEDEKWDRKYRGKLDLVVSTIASSKAPTGSYLKMLKYKGSLVQVGNPDDGQISIPQGLLIGQKLSFSGSTIGSAGEIREMLQLAADKGIKGWVQERPMKEANQALLDIEAGKPRYRYCLVNEDANKASL